MKKEDFREKLANRDREASYRSFKDRSKILRNTSTPEGKTFWDSAVEAAKEVDTWPDSKRAGINVSDRRKIVKPKDLELVDITTGMLKARGRVRVGLWVHSMDLPEDVREEIYSQAHNPVRPDSFSYPLFSAWLEQEGYSDEDLGEALFDEVFIK